ncbi:M48 family metallopeptidase [[Clostridium] fimetarium]|uniref:YgjP-like metallopeptidase domain-containing protein n=1 Tax=[Clostridium] fimetarium TaxID=99656 RepID=A0A1I0PWV8_9FIRM|nr:SprT family zinc-dependent metalloprotease [[Clostridium] fimetarium]SEW18628.1 hypothetical protein SAMN05421659_10660 [[Clostridium] fimetarium]
MFAFQYNTSKIEYNLIKSKRKTISISVDSKGNVLVKAPLRLSDEKVLELIKNKSSWIEEKLLLVQDTIGQQQERQYKNGETFYYLGNEYVLKIIEDTVKKRLSVNIYDDKLVVTIPTSKADFIHEGIGNETIIKLAIIKWYKQMAKVKILERVNSYENLFAKKRGPVIVKEQKKRWGSCSQDGTLRFNWRIIMAPEYIIDYIVVHELCHLKYMNHAREFWNLVESILPDYKIRKEWLKKNGIMLEL